MTRVWCISGDVVGGHGDVLISDLRSDFWADLNSGLNVVRRKKLKNEQWESKWL